MIPELMKEGLHVLLQYKEDVLDVSQKHPGEMVFASIYLGEKDEVDSSSFSISLAIYEGEVIKNFESTISPAQKEKIHTSLGQANALVATTYSIIVIFCIQTAEMTEAGVISLTPPDPATAPLPVNSPGSGTLN